MRRVHWVLVIALSLSLGLSVGLLAQQPGYQQPPYSQQSPYTQPPYAQPGYPPPYQGQQTYPGQQPQYPPQQQQPDPVDRPGEAVARLGVMNGDVAVRRGDSGDWVAAVLNAPVMAGDSISVPAGAKAELQLDNGNYVRIGGDTEVRLSALDPGHIQIQMAKGLITYRVLRDSNNQAEISTPAVAVHPLRLSAVRVEIAPDGMTRITVRHGDAEASTPKGTERIHEGGMMLVRGAQGGVPGGVQGDEPEYQIVAAAGRDAWDGFNDQRDSYLLRAQSNRNLNPDIYGAEDLDNYGTWGNDPQYGNVWTPNVPPGWTPYSDGQWVWEDFYGWTWVDYSPWGWAPFHYGSWYLRTGIGWTWFPGPRLGHFWWHPAMVGFFGFGGGIGVGFGFGNVGWVALAPFELFHPWYGPGVFGGRFGVGFNAGLVRNANIAGLYRNARVGGITAVSGADFQRGQFRNHIAVNGAQLQQASLVRGALPITPSANNLRFSDRTASAAGPRNEIGSQRFFSRTGVGSASAQRTPFAQQQAAMRSAFAGAERGGPSMGGAPRPPQAPGSGWQRFGSPNQAGPARSPADNGWDRFGSPQGQRSVQVAPPIVQQRQSAPSYNRGSSPGSRGSAPAMRSGGGGHASGGGHSGRR